jgi:hypothetical protein
MERKEGEFSSCINFTEMKGRYKVCSDNFIACERRASILLYSQQSQAIQNDAFLAISSGSEGCTSILILILIP